MEHAQKPQDKAQQATKPTSLDKMTQFTPLAPTLPVAGQRLDPVNILNLQRTLGNRGTQELLRAHTPPKPKLQRQKEATQEAENDQPLNLQEGESEIVNGQVSSKILALPGAIQRKDANGKMETLLPMADGSYVGLQQIEQPTPAQHKSIPISQVQRSANSNTAPVMVTTAPNGDIQRIDKTKIGKRIGYGAANFFSEALIGPLTDLKHLVRVIHYNVQDDPEKEAKTKKIRDRVKEEWVGEYPGAKWMSVFHAIATGAEKLAALAGVITLIATIASIWMGAAAPIATVAGLVALSLASLALLVRSLLSGVSLYKFKNGGDAAFKKMAIVNLVQGIGNALAIVSFGVGTHMGGGISMDSTAKGADGFGKELGAGLAFAFGTKAATVSNDIVQSKPNSLQREGGGGATMSPQALELANVLEQADNAIPGQRRAAQQDKADVTANQGVLAQSNAKVGSMLGQSEETKAKSSEMNTAADATTAEAEAPTEDMADDVSPAEVGDIEEQLAVGEANADAEKLQTAENKPQKKGFWSKVKDKAKAAGKTIKKGLSAFFGRIMGVWRRFKALAAKIKAKVVAFILRITGLDVEVKKGQALIQEDIASQPQQMQSATEYGESVEQLDGTMKEYR